jgi:hypothetical protein
MRCRPRRSDDDDGNPFVCITFKITKQRDGFFGMGGGNCGDKKERLIDAGRCALCVAE